MNLADLTPPLRLELREIPAGENAPWALVDLAHTQSQAEAKLSRLVASLPETVEARIAPNLPVAVLEPDAEAEAEAAQISEETAQLIANLRRDNADLARQLAEAKAVKVYTAVTAPTTSSSSGGGVAAVAPAVAAAPSAPAVDTIVGETPLPFSVGDFLTDVHTKVRVRVTAINPLHESGPHKGTPRPGFAWDDPAKKPGEPDSSGFVPLNGIGNFKAAGAKGAVKSSGRKSPPKKKTRR